MDDASLLASLPDDPAALKAMVAAVTRQRDALEQRSQALERRSQELEVQKLRLEVELLRLKKLYYGPRADRLNTPGELAQMLLDFAAGLEERPVNGDDLPPPPPPPLPQGGPAADADSKSARRLRKGRRNLADFDRLPVTRHVHDL